MRTGFFKILFVLLIVVVGAYFVSSYIKNRSIEQIKQTEEKAATENIKKRVAQSIKDSNAIATWEKDLMKEELEPVQTIELEKLWLTERPILFRGAIKDIETRDHDNYWVRIEYRTFDYMFGTGLELTLQCPKEKIDKLLMEQPDMFKDYGFKNGVAVIADVDEIQTKAVLINENNDEVRMGLGRCMDIIYVGGTYW